MHYIMAVCLVVLCIVQVVDYIMQGEFSLSSICIVFALLPMTVKGFRPDLKNVKNFRYFEIIAVVLAVSLLIAEGLRTM